MREITGRETETDGGGATSFPLRLILAVLFGLSWKKEKKKGVFKFLVQRLKPHFFLPSPGGAAGGWWGCHNADGLYFDYGA